MNSKPTVEDIMSKSSIVAFPDERVIDVARRLFENDFHGLPVVDINNKVVGIITQYDLISKGTSLHIPTFIKLLEKLPVLRQEKDIFKKEIAPIIELKVKDVMNADPLMIRLGESIETVSRAFSEHHKVNPIPVVDGARKLKGVVSRHDIIKFLVAPSGAVSAQKSIDIQIDEFIDNFEDKFAVTTKTRAKYWLFFSVLSAIVGFFIAFALIMRFVIH